MFDPVPDNLPRSPEAEQPSVDQIELAKDLARREIEARQNAENQQATKKHAQKEAVVTTQAAEARADLIAPTVVPEKKDTPVKAPETGTVAPEQQTKLAQGPQEAPSTTPSTIPPSRPTSPPASPPSTPSSAAPVSSPEKSFGVKFKEFIGKMFEGFKGFFANISVKISEIFNKIFKKSSPQASAAPSNSPVSTPGASPESRSEDWKGVVMEEAKRLGIEPAFAYAIVSVEAGKKGLNPNGTPVIRFEPHVFNSQLAQKGIREKHGKWGSSTLNGRNVDGISCEGGQANEHTCLQKAMEINKDAALRSVSMGLGQIMGFNHALAGYGSAEEMFNSFAASGGGENAQIRAMFKLIEKTPPILNAARRKDFGAFTMAYNGSKPGTDLYSRYTTSLQNSYRAHGGGQAGSSAVA